MVGGEGKVSMSEKRVENDSCSQVVFDWCITTVGLKGGSVQDRGSAVSEAAAIAEPVIVQSRENIRLGRRSNVRSVRRHVWGGRSENQGAL